MVFPLLLALVAFLGFLGYFARRNITWTARKGTSGSLGMAIVVLIIFAIIGWGLDAYLGWSVIPQYMWAVGGTLQMIGAAFYAAFILLILSMLWSSYKCGQLVA